MEPEVQSVEAPKAREPLEQREGGPKRAQGWPGIAEDRRRDGYAGPDEDPEEDRGKGCLAANEERAQDGAIPPHEADGGEQPAQRPRGQRRQGQVRIAGSGGTDLDGDGGDDEGGTHRDARPGEVHPERDRKLEDLAKGVGGRGRGDREEADSSPGQRREAEPSTGH